MPNLPSRDFLQNLDIKEGETLTMDCPKCNGVKKFSISNLDGMLLYNCYRASCDVKGSFLTNMLVDTIKQKLTGEIEGKPHEKFEMPEHITDGDNAYIQRFRSRWDLMADVF